MRFSEAVFWWIGLVALALAFAQVVNTQRASPSGPDGIVPFRIQVSNAVLTDLKQRLAQTRYAEQFNDEGWNTGTNQAYLRSLIDYWRDRYDWRAAEKRLNAFDQFTTNIDGIDVHFIHQRSASPDATPLLLLNGWPSSIVEYQDVIGPLTNPAAFGAAGQPAFHVVIPSMPGFGFSGKPTQRGYDFDRIAAMWATLMARLGYNRYAVHGSDFGNLVAPRVALRDAAHVSGLHLAGCGGAPAPAGGQAPPPLPTPAMNPLVNAAHNAGYQEIQSTKPQTLGAGLTDSPAGLASWIVEKWYDWTDHDGDLETVFSKDELLSNIMIYWVTNSATSSARIYFEGRHTGGMFRPTPFPAFEGRVTVPTGCGAFPRQYDRRTVRVTSDTPEARKAAETRYNIVHFTTMPRGGHFPAFEQPTLWLDDIRAFLKTIN